MAFLPMGRSTNATKDDAFGNRFACDKLSSTGLRPLWVRAEPASTSAKISQLCRSYEQPAYMGKNE
jgi:hypothetical protein